jgi:thiol-disulfide isomerase/thioredoxin
MAGTGLQVVCLCAAWCGACREYRAVFEALGAQFAGQAEFAWIDIEDEADALGDPDIENFPTLLLADAAALRFLGPVTPHAQTAERLVRGALAGDLPPPALDADSAALARRVRALLAGGRAAA